jgi:hypothetical protein
MSLGEVFIPLEELVAVKRDVRQTIRREQERSAGWRRYFPGA